MDEHDDFDSVSWRNDPESDASRPTTSGTDAEEPHKYDQDTNGKRRMSSAHEEPQAGPLADAVDLAGIGDGVLECRVDSPLKENDGTKDAYISYLVTTNVSLPDSLWTLLGQSCSVTMAACRSHGSSEYLHPPKARSLTYPKTV
jgi:sorting nexin-4